MTLEQAAAAAGLAVLGGLHPEASDGAPPGTATLLLLGPAGPEFWETFCAAPERADGAPDPLDRWSRRVIGRLANEHGAAALFPFDGPPWLPFQAWARRTGRAWVSPVGMLVHDRTGLFFSVRGALALPERLALPSQVARPCETCARPCLSACPVGALTGAGYDVAACRSYLETTAGLDCIERGCAVRRSCPVGQGLRPDAQSAFHMAAFHGRHGR